MKINFSYLLKLKQEKGYKSLAKCAIECNLNIEELNIYKNCSLYRYLPELEYDSQGFCVLDKKPIYTKSILMYRVENICLIKYDDDIHHNLTDMKNMFRSDYNTQIIKSDIFKSTLVTRFLVGDYPKTVKLIDDSYNKLFKNFNPLLLYPRTITVINPTIYDILSKYKQLNVTLDDTYYYRYVNLASLQSSLQPTRVDGATLDESVLTAQRQYIWENDSAEVIEYAINNLTETEITESLKGCKISDTAYRYVHDRLSNGMKIMIYNNLRDLYNIYHIEQSIHNISSVPQKLCYGYPIVSKQILKTMTVKESLRAFKKFFPVGIISWYLTYKTIKHCKGDIIINSKVIYPLLVRWDNEIKKREYLDALLKKVVTTSDSRGSITGMTPELILFICDKQKEHNKEYLYAIISKTPIGTFSHHMCNKSDCILGIAHSHNMKRAI